MGDESNTQQKIDDVESLPSDSEKASESPVRVPQNLTKRKTQMGTTVASVCSSSKRRLGHTIDSEKDITSPPKRTRADIGSSSQATTCSSLVRILKEDKDDILAELSEQKKKELLQLVEENCCCTNI